MMTSYSKRFNSGRNVFGVGFTYWNLRVKVKEILLHFELLKTDLYIYVLERSKDTRRGSQNVDITVLAIHTVVIKIPEPK